MVAKTPKSAKKIANTPKVASKTSKAAETPKAPVASVESSVKPPKTAKTPKAPVASVESSVKPPKPAKTPKVVETSKAPVASSESSVKPPKTAKTPKVVETPKAPVASSESSVKPPKTAKTPKVVETSKAPVASSESSVKTPKAAAKTPAKVAPKVLKTPKAVKVHKVPTPPKPEVKEEDTKPDVKVEEGQKKPAEAKTPFPIAEKLDGAKAQVQLAVTALKKYFAEKNEKSLFPEIDYSLRLEVSYKKPAVASDRIHVRIQLPNTTRTIANTSVCLVFPDLDQSEKARVDFDVDKQSREWAEKIEVDHGITSSHYSKIFTKRELERVAGSYKLKRDLASAYDIFLVDSRVYKSVKNIFGKEFHKAHKIPLFFRYNKPLSTAIEESLSATTYPLRKYMTRASVTLGHLGQEKADLVENVNKAIDEIIKVCPGGFQNIRNMYLQPFTGQPNLPIYVDDGASSEIDLPPPAKRRHLEEVVDECSTLPDGLKIAIRKNGRIRVLKDEDNQSILYPTVNDEWSELDGLKPTKDPKKVQAKREKRKKERTMIKKKAIRKSKKVKKTPKKAPAAPKVSA